MVHKLMLFLMLYCFRGAEANRYTCYYCYTEHGYHAPYDENCGNTSYAGNFETAGFKKGCAIEILDDGNVWRGFEGKHQANHDSDCQRVQDDHRWATRCFCQSDKCNNYNCEHCFPTTPTTTTIKTTSTTQQPLNKELSCYNCIDCPIVDANTTVVFDENFLTCVTSMTDQGTIIRSGGFEEHPDGECFVDGTVTQCHCTTSLCNNAGLTGLSCYNCYDCPTVYENTTAEFDPGFQTCVTITTDQGTIIRSGSFDAHADGECVVDGIMTKCHCTTFLCNNA